MIIEILLTLFLGLFIGYNIGYSRGCNYFRKKREKILPLIIKEKSLQKGYCIICGKEEKFSQHTLDPDIDIKNNI